MANLSMFSGGAVLDVVASAIVVVAAVASICPCCWPITLPILLLAACVNITKNGCPEPPPCPGRTGECGKDPDAGQQCNAVASGYDSCASMALVNASAGMGGGAVSSASNSSMISGGGSSFGGGGGGMVTSPMLT